MSSRQFPGRPSDGRGVLGSDLDVLNWPGRTLKWIPAKIRRIILTGRQLRNGTGAMSHCTRRSLFLSAFP